MTPHASNTPRPRTAPLTPRRQSALARARQGWLRRSPEDQAFALMFGAAAALALVTLVLELAAAARGDLTVLKVLGAGAVLGTFTLAIAVGIGLEGAHTRLADRLRATEVARLERQLLA